MQSTINTTKKIAKVRSDIYFLSKCKQSNVTPKGLITKNPLTSTYNTFYSRKLCQDLEQGFLTRGARNVPRGAGMLNH